MNILIINCGSSSLKYQLIEGETEQVLAKGLCERIGIEGSCFTHQGNAKEKLVLEIAMKNHTEAIQIVLKYLMDQEYGVISSLNEIHGVGHRVVHGGEKFSESVLLSDEVIKEISECSDLAPLHNPANLIGILACRELMKDIPMTAVFDTAFHQTIPEKAYLYGIPYEYYEKYKIRRYGFHGTSHDFVSKRAAEMIGKDRKDLNIIVCHLGNGASVCAVCHGKSVDTSMGFTPLEGSVMGTRSGDLDAAILEYLAQKEKFTMKEMMEMLNKRSGILGISGLSSDFRDLAEAAEKGNDRAKAALEVFAYRIGKYIGAYAAAMNGVDIIAFTAGAGENNSTVRGLIGQYLGFLGTGIDSEKNKKRGEEMILSKPDSSVVTMVVPTNEELAIARETMKFL